MSISTHSLHSDFRKTAVCSALFLSSLLVSLVSWAQQGSSSALSLEELVVTAQKRQESSQDVPIALSAFGSEDLVASGAVGLKDITKQAPGVVFESTSTASQPLLYVRGVGTRQFQLGSDPSVGVFVDGVYVPRFSAQNMALLDIERVEVLKGPQGTIYGRNTIGGAINVITKRPTEDFVGRLEASYGQGSRNSNSVWHINGSASGQVSENVLYAVALSHSEDEGNTRLSNPLTGETSRGNARDEQSFRGKLEFLLSDELRLGFTASYQDGDNSPRIFFPSSVGGIRSPGFPALLDPSLTGPGVVPTDPYDLEGDVSVRGHSRREILDLSMTLDWETSLGTVTSITSYFDSSVDELSEGDNTRFNAQITPVQEESDTWAEELRLAGATDDGTWTWLVGTYFYSDDANRKDIIGLGLDSNASTSPRGPNGGAMARIAELAANPNDPFGIGIPALVDQFDTSLDAEGYSFFGQFSYRPVEPLNLTFGLRYSKDEKFSPLVATTELPGFTPFIPGNFSLDREGEWNSVDPMASISYDMNDDAMVYLSYRTGYKSGGFQDLNGSAARSAIPFDEETVDAWELGIKSELLDRRVRLNASVFNYDYEDLQLQTQLMPGSPARLTTNAASTTLQGLDLELKALVSQNLTVDLSYAYLDAEFEEFMDNGGNDFSGTRLAQAPEHKLNLIGSYTSETDYGEVGVRLGVSYTGELLLVQQANNVNPGPGILGGALGNSGLEEPSRTIVDLSFSLARNDWRAVLFANNLTDEIHRVSAVEQRNSTALLEVYNQPRVIGARFVYNFGSN